VTNVQEFVLHMRLTFASKYDYVADKGNKQ